MLTVLPLVMTAVLNTMSVPELPTVQSKTAVPAPEACRAHVAVPLNPETPLVMALAVAVPEDDAANAVVLNVSVTRRFCVVTAVPGLAG